MTDPTEPKRPLAQDDFRLYLTEAIRHARFTPDALDPKAAGILENVLFCYDATRHQTPPSIALDGEQP